MWRFGKITSTEAVIQPKMFCLLQAKFSWVLVDRNQKCTFCSACVQSSRCAYSGTSVHWQPRYTRKVT